QSSTILRTDLIGRGGITSTTVDIRLIMRIAIESFATGIILCHNHPSGEVTPSKQDIQLTNQIKKAADFFNITVVDHLIINKNHYYSFHQEGILFEGS
ncbi:MAG: JAB domain-containing protein, partial [Bacteroidales bacterium]